ncbi:hypothetical protein VZQ01_24190 [Myxococcus faecalis]|uniref:hypothetical protein n=1 Tax=Myxococcus faecalis TaxID=3115646 RepID=UPI003CED7102
MGDGLARSQPSLGAGDRDSKLAQAPTGTYVLGEPLSPSKPVVRRAPDFEWEVLERVEPRFAAFLETRAQHYLALGRDPSEPTEE